MKSTAGNILNGGVVGNVGRQLGSKNKQTITIENIGWDRAISLLEAHLISAESGDDEARKFILERIFPAAKPGRFLDLNIPRIKCLADVIVSQQAIQDYSTTGVITLEEADKLFANIAHHVKTLELTELAEKVDNINNRMKEAGI